MFVTRKTILAAVLLACFAFGSSYSAKADVVINDAGFEAPHTNAYTYNPTGGSWTFTGNSGVTANGSGFTSGNPSAPQGSQAAFLQTGGKITQTLTGFASGSSYIFSFDAAQRGNYGYQSTFSVFLDNALIGTYTPGSTSYSTFNTNSIVAGAGSHALQFFSTITSNDNTSFIDNVRVSSVGAVPEPSSTATLALGAIVVGGLMLRLRTRIKV